MHGSFAKGVAVGLACALLGGGAVALAGSGVGGVFNLGVSNSVDAQTNLSGSTNAPELHVANTNVGSAAAGVSANGKSPAAAALAGGNTSSGAGVAGSSASGPGVAGGSASGPGVSGQSTSGFGMSARSASSSQPALRSQNTGGGPAGGFLVSSGVAPFTVNSTAKVVNLNADLLDGVDSSALVQGLPAGSGYPTPTGRTMFFREHEFARSADVRGLLVVPGFGAVKTSCTADAHNDAYIYFYNLSSVTEDFFFVDQQLNGFINHGIVGPGEGIVLTVFAAAPSGNDDDVRLQVTTGENTPTGQQMFNADLFSFNLADGDPADDQCIFQGNGSLQST